MAWQPLSSQLSGCAKLDIGRRTRRESPGFQMTDGCPDDNRDLVRVNCFCQLVAPIGNSDHSSMSAIISMAQAVPNLCVSRKVFPKQQIDWNTDCSAIQDLP